MKEVMIDFETLSTRSDTMVLQIGAAEFDRKNQVILNSMLVNVDVKSYKPFNYGHIDPDTVLWWLSQKGEAKQSVAATDRIGVHTAFNQLNSFLKDVKYVWSHATFDFPIMESSMKALDIKPNYHFTSGRDLRTMISESGVNPKSVKREGVHHNALDDVYFQIKVLFKCFDAMKGK